MRNALILLLYCFFCYPRMLAQQPASIEGVVVNSVSGAPLSRVHLKLGPQNPGEEPAPVYGAMSNDAGRFSIAAIQPAVAYRLDVERAGFILYPTVEQAPSSVIIRTFKPGEGVTGYKLEMAPRVVISGRVLDENGEPMPGVGVLARRVPQPVPMHSAPMAWGSTDDRGMFRLAVPPERYNLIASVQSNPSEGPEIRTDGSVDSQYLPTYYPSTLSRESAAIVEARPGADVNGIDIRPVHSAMLHISGTVSGIPACASGAEVLLISKTGYQERAVPAGHDGKFSFTRLDPGSYRIHARCHTGDEPLQSQVVDLTLTNSSLDFLSLALTRGFELSGTVLGVPPTGINQREIALFPVRTESDYDPWRQRSAPEDADGSFRIKGVEPGEYEVEVRWLPDGAYVKSLRLGNTEAADAVIDLRNGSTAASLTVTVGAVGGQISGLLEGKNSEVLHRLGFVYVVQDGKDWAPRHRHGQETSSDGSFTIQSLPPGKYRIFATVYGITPFPPGGDNTQRFRELAAAADVIEIHEGDKLVRNAKVVGAK
jgi:hypothetical protein